MDMIKQRTDMMGGEEEMRGSGADPVGKGSYGLKVPPLLEGQTLLERDPVSESVGMPRMYVRIRSSGIGKTIRESG
jgi:hypothetical protein